MPCSVVSLRNLGVTSKSGSQTYKLPKRTTKCSEGASGKGSCYTCTETLANTQKKKKKNPEALPLIVSIRVKSTTPT